MSFTKQTPTKPGAYWWKQRPDQCAFLVERFKDGTYRMAGTGIIYNVDMLECGEWEGPLVTADEAQADAAAMREALEHAHTAINYAVTTGFEDTIKTIVNAALSVNAGRELLGELKRLRTELAEMTTIAEKARTRELEQLDELSTLRTDLAKAQSQCAAMRFVLEQVAEIEVHGQPTALALQAASALSTDCGRDYVHRSEVEKAWHEGFIDGDFGEALADDCWNQSRARKVATGEL